MLPTINKRFLFKMLLTLTAFVGTLAGVHAFQARRIPEALLKQANRAADAGKKDAAIGYLRQYLEFRPLDADAQVQLAELVKNRATGNAYDLLLIYERILRTDPARHTIRREALQVSLKIGRNTDAETHARFLLQIDPADADIWRGLASAQQALHQPTDEVVKSLNEAIRRDSKNQAAYLQLAQFLRREHRPAEAKTVHDQLIAALPEKAESYIERAVFATLIDESPAVPIDAAIADLRKALMLERDHPSALLLLAEQLQRGRDLAEASDLLAKGVALYPQDPRFVRSLSWLEFNRGNIGSSVAVLEAALAHVPEKDSFELLATLADLLVRLGETERSRDILAKLEGSKKKDGPMQAKYIRGRLAMREDHWDDAIEIFQQLRIEAAKLPGLENQCMMLMAKCYRSRGNPAREIECLAQLLNRDPQHLEGRETLGQAYLNAGRFDEAIREYEVAARSAFATVNARAILLKMKAAQLRTQSPPPAPALWDALEAEAKDVAAKVGPSNSDGAILRADIATRRGATERAVAILRTEASRRPSDIKLWGALAQTLADLAGTAVGLAVLDEAQALAGDSPDVRLARAVLYTRDPAKLRSIERLAGQIDTWPDSEQQRLLDGLLEIYDRLGDDAGMLKTFRRMAGRRFTEPALWDAVYERAAKANDPAMKAEAEAALAKLPKGTETRALRRAWDALTQPAEAPAAREALLARFGASPDRADVCIALGRLHELGGDRAAAESSFDRAGVLEPNRHGPVQARIEFQARHREAMLPATVKQLAQDYRWSGEKFQRVVRKAIGRLDPASARKLLEIAKRWNEGAVGEFAWLGDGYTSLKLPKEAEASFEFGVLSPRATIDDWLRLALVQTGSEALIALLERAREKLPPMQYAVLLASVAESSAAAPGWKPELKTGTEQRQFGQISLALKLSRFQRRESIAMLEAFLADSKRSKGDAAWARRNLAMLYVAEGNPLDRKKAKELLAGKDNSPGETEDEKRATAAVLAGLARHLESEDRKQVVARSIEILSEVAAVTQDRRDQFLLAQMCRTSGDRDGRIRGRKLLLALLENDGKNIDYLVTGLEEASEPEDREFADGCASRLLANFPADFRAVAAVARYETRSGRPERALELAEGYTRTADSAPGSLQLRYARAAELLDELARSQAVRRTALGRKMTDSAVAKYEAIFAHRPEAVVAAAGLLAADGRADDAFAKIERHAKLLPVGVKLPAGLAAIRPGTATPRQVALVQTWLAEAKAGEPGSIATLMNEADFYTLQSDFAKAEAAYEAALALDDRNVAALNNLAWLLAANPLKTERATALMEKAVTENGLTGDLLDTRARIEIAAKQFDSAERDLTQALALEKSPLRMFHLALALQSQSPPRPAEAATMFRTAKAKGLKEQSIHPADIAVYRAMLKDSEK